MIGSPEPCIDETTHREKANTDESVMTLASGYDQYVRLDSLSLSSFEEHGL